MKFISSSGFKADAKGTLDLTELDLVSQTLNEMIKVNVARCLLLVRSPSFEKPSQEV